MSRPTLPRIRGTQIGLKNKALVDQIKASMRSGQFAYEELSCRVVGIRDYNGVYHLIEGHHRMVAALEHCWERNDSSYVSNLISCGIWREQENPPINSRPLPARYWWGAFRNWLGI